MTEEITPEPQKKTSNGKIIAFAGCGCLGLIALVTAGVAIIFFSVIGAVKNSDTYGDTLVLIQSNPLAIEALGEPIEAGLWLTGSIEIKNGVGAANLSVPVSGPKGNGTFHVVADRPSGSRTWNYTTRELCIDGEDAPVIQLSP